jgi:dolichol-phosphate mannosyltransferase
VEQREADQLGGERTLIVTPTYNERVNLPLFVERLRSVAPRVQVLIVDDASPDGTGQLAEELASKDPLIHVRHRAGKLGLGTAYVEAFTWALEQERYDYVFEMDADLSHDPAHLPAMFHALRAGSDVVIGSRNVPGGGIRGWGIGRHILSKGGSLYSRWVLGVGVRDLTTGYKGYTKAALARIGLARIASNGYSFQIETTYRALRAGLRVAEVPIVFVDREVGSSKMSGRIFLEAVGVVWKLRLAGLLGRL